ncbi:MAG TPA: transcriptional regulator [Acidimicrobiales bacterium]
MRALRLVELLVRLQLQGGAPAPELAAALGVSVRTIYRDVATLSAAGVPVRTEVGRNGGVRIDPSYRVAGLPRLDPAEARGLLFAVVPALADQLGFDADVADRTLLPAMEPSTEAAARVVRDRLLVEPTHWFAPPDATPALADVARAVWEAREVRLTYRGADDVVQPLGLILKGTTWYLLGRARQRGERLYRLSRVEAVELLGHRFERPPEFDLAAAWAARRRAFLATMPERFVTVRVAPEAEPLLGLLDEGAPDLPLPDDVERDEHGWARLRLRFERSEAGAARQLLRLGAGVEVLAPARLRARLARTAADLAALYRT